MKSSFVSNCLNHVLAGPGSFLVRPSDNSPGDYSLFFHINNQIQRFRIEKKGVRYVKLNLKTPKRFGTKEFCISDTLWVAEFLSV